MRVRTRVFCGHGELVQVSQLVSLRRWRRLSEPLQKLFKVSTQEIHTKETSIFKKKTTRELPTVQEPKKEQAAVQTAAGALHS